MPVFKSGRERLLEGLEPLTHRYHAEPKRLGPFMDALSGSQWLPVALEELEPLLLDNPALTMRMLNNISPSLSAEMAAGKDRAILGVRLRGNEIGGKTS